MVSHKIVATVEEVFLDFPDDLRKESVIDLPQRYFRLGFAQWRIYIDGQHHHLGEDVYIEAKHRGEEAKEPKYNESMTKADRLLSKSLGKVLMHKIYSEVHHTATAHFSSHRRKPRKTDTDHDDIVRLPIGEKDKDVEKETNIINFDSKASWDENSGVNLYKLVHVAVDLRKKFDDILENYYKNIGTLKSKKEKLTLIAYTHQELERLHYFEDGNARTNKLILNKFLVENEFSGTILHTPIGVEHKTSETWTNVVIQGQTHYQRIVEDILYEDVELFIKILDKVLAMEVIFGHWIGVRKPL